MEVQSAARVPFLDLVAAPAKLNDVALALRAEAERVYKDSRTIPKGPPPPRAPVLHVEIASVQGEAQGNGVRGATFVSGGPPRIRIEVVGKARYDQLDEPELVSFWDNVLYELQNARYDAAIRAEKRATEPFAFGLGRARREAYATVFHLRSLGRLLRGAGDAVAFGNALGLSARRAIKFADYPGDQAQLERAFTESPHRAAARPGTRYSLPSAHLYAYEWLIDQEAGKIAGYIIGRAFDLEHQWSDLTDSLVTPVDEELTRRGWNASQTLPWTKPKLFLDVVEWTIVQVGKADGVIPVRIGAHWHLQDKRKHGSEGAAAAAFVEQCTKDEVPRKLANPLPEALVIVARQEFEADTDPTAGPPPEDVWLKAPDIERFLLMEKGLQGIPEP